MFRARARENLNGTRTPQWSARTFQQAMMRPRSFALVATALLAISAFAVEVETIKTLRAQMRYDVMLIREF
jgi:hypothetical protein